jgi:hypothetical protein
MSPSHHPFETQYSVQCVECRQWFAVQVSPTERTCALCRTQGSPSSESAPRADSQVPIPVDALPQHPIDALLLGLFLLRPSVQALYLAEGPPGVVCLLTAPVRPALADQLHALGWLGIEDGWQWVWDNLQPITPKPLP